MVLSHLMVVCCAVLSFSVSTRGNPQTLGLMPSIKFGSGPITWPVPGKAGQWSVPAPPHVYTNIQSPPPAVYKQNLSPNSLTSFSNSISKIDSEPEVKAFIDPLQEESVHSFATVPRNHSSRFFTFNSGGKSLDLGISFTVPFVSIPVNSILNMGAQTTTALTEILNVNWPVFLTVGSVLLAAALFLPKIAPLIIAALSKFNTNYKSTDQPLSSYVDYMRSLEVSPFTSIMNQIDEAMKEYDLDSTSCMQRVVCSYAANADSKVISGRANSANLIINGLTKSSLIIDMLGDNALTEALRTGRDGSSCSNHFSKCPLSLPGIVGFLGRMATNNR